MFDRQCAELGVTFKAPRHIVAVGSLQTPDLPTSQLVTLSTGVTRMAAETLPKYRPCRVTAMDLRHFSVLLPLEADEVSRSGGSRKKSPTSATNSTIQARDTETGIPVSSR